MHAYASDSPFRSPTVYLVLAAIGAGVAWTLSLVVKTLTPEPPWWLEIPSTLTCFGLVVWVYDRVAWRWWSDLPNLAGTWVGEIRSSFDEQQVIPCALRVRQSWLRVGIELETSHSLSHSTMASLMLDHGLETGLRYEYLSEPSPSAPKTMQTHRGTAHIRIDKAGKTAALHYYTGRGRNTTGEIRLQRVSHDQLGLGEALRQEINDNQ